MAELGSINKYQFIDFYCGFNGEGEVILYADNGEMHIWDGYFIPIMHCALAKEVAEYKEAFCKKEVVEVHEALVKFFREAKGVVYIEEC